MSDLGSWGASPANKSTYDTSGAAGAGAASGGASKVSSQESPWPVSRLSATLKDWIDRLGMLWIEGEVAKISISNNMFAQLRDLQTDNSIEIHSFNLGKIDQTIKQGDRVVALIKPSFWPKPGKLTMQVFEMRKVGLGELLERIERLRAQLAAEGLTQVKQPLPYLPQLIGLVTGKDSDAEKDVLQNARLRWPEVQFKVVHTLVQGERAAPQIIAAIEQLDADPAVDVIIVARGGGSFLDLLVFSDEALVRAAAATRKPLVSAIGHEADRPVLDDVADLRASTPTDAAKRVVPDVQEERLRIGQLLNRMFVRVGGQVNQGLDLLAQLRSRPILANPYTFITLRQEQIDRALADTRGAFGRQLSHEQLRLDHLKQQIRSLSPQSTLDRGYAVVRTAAGQVITDAAEVEPGTQIEVRVAHGQLKATTN